MNESKSKRNKASWKEEGGQKKVKTGMLKEKRRELQNAHRTITTKSAMNDWI